MISIQTNVDSLVAQRNLGIDDAFQSKTIQQLTSGYRINDSGDDAAGLAIANGYDSTIAQLTQGVSNANDGTSQLQIVDGGLSNISTILNRLQTLATQSASSTFTGDRSILNQEYSSLTAEITRQASNINLNAGGSFNSNLNVFIGGGSNAANSSVNVNLSGASNAVDAASLGLASTNVLGGGVGFTGNTQRLDAPGATFLAGSASASESFTFNVATSSGAQTVTAKVNGSVAGVSSSDVLSQLNGTLSQYGITAGLDSNGLLQFSGATAFNVTDNGALNATTGTSLTTATATTVATGQAFSGLTGNDQEVLSGTANGTAFTLTTLTSSNAGSIAAAISQINSDAQLPTGLKAVANSTNTGINLEYTGAGSLVLNSKNTNTTAANSNPANGFFAGSQTVSGVGTPTVLGSTDTEQLTITAGSGSPLVVNLSGGNGTGDTAAHAIATINAAEKAAAGSSAVSFTAVSNGTGGINLVSANGDSIGVTALNSSASKGYFTDTASTYTATGQNFVPLASGETETISVTGGGSAFNINLNSTNADNAADALTAIQNAIAGAGANGTGITATNTNGVIALSYAGTGLTVTSKNSNAADGVFAGTNPTSSATVAFTSLTATATQTLTITPDGGNGTAKTITLNQADTGVNSTDAGDKITDVVASINNAFGAGTASVSGSNIVFSLQGANGFTISAGTNSSNDATGLAAGAATVTTTEASQSITDTSTSAAFAQTVTNSATAVTVGALQLSASNTANYSVSGAPSYTAPGALNTEVLTFQGTGQAISVDLNSTNAGTATAALATINAATSGAGIHAILNSAGTGIEFQSANSFSVNSQIDTTASLAAGTPTAASAAAPGVFGSALSTNVTATAPASGSTTNAQAAITAINAAIAQIGLVQGTVGAGENLLSYATNLAQSQISSFSSAESQIKDADVAADAANLTKAQVLTQTSIAALAQANSEPQSILKLLQ